MFEKTLKSTNDKLSFARMGEALLQQMQIIINDNMNLLIVNRQLWFTNAIFYFFFIIRQYVFSWPEHSGTICKHEKTLV